MSLSNFLGNALYTLASLILMCEMGTWCPRQRASGRGHSRLVKRLVATFLPLPGDRYRRLQPKCRNYHAMWHRSPSPRGQRYLLKSNSSGAWVSSPGKPEDGDCNDDPN